MQQTDHRHLDTFPLEPSVRAKLSAAGMISADHVRGKSVENIASILGRSSAEAQAVVDILNDEGKQIRAPESGITAQALFQSNMASAPIPSWCRGIDKLLGGGFAPKALTEVCGAPGCGKSQLCMQACITAQLSYSSGAAHCIYIDTEGSFSVERLAIIADAMLNKRRALNNGNAPLSSNNNDEILSLLNNVHVIRAFDYVELIAIIHQLDGKIESIAALGGCVRLVVIDSLAFHFRHAFDDMSLRTRILSSLAATLISLSDRHSNSILLTNHMTTRLKPFRELIPALGESWSHAPTCRVILKIQGTGASTKRIASLVKSPSMPPGSVPYTIGEAGLIDADADADADADGNNNGGLDDGDPFWADVLAQFDPAD